MYTRQITNAPESIIMNGKPIFGTFFGIPKTCNLKNIKHPFTMSLLPKFITNLRLRRNATVFFLTKEYIGTIDVLDATWFGFTEINFWDKQTGRRLSYRSLIPRRKIIPFNLDKGQCESFKKKRYFRIKWNHEENKFSFVFNIQGDSVRPFGQGTFMGSLAGEKNCEITSVLPAPVMRRCVAVYQNVIPVTCGISTSSLVASITPQNSNGLAFFSLRHAFYKLRTKSSELVAMGKVKDKDIVIRLYTSTQDPTDTLTYNENFLYVDGIPTPLPPVRITQPHGIMGMWVIQDTESMVDLFFKPASDTVRTLSIFVLRTEYHTISGICGGTLLTKEGEALVIKEMSAITKKHSLRL